MKRTSAPDYRSGKRVARKSKGFSGNAAPVFTAPPRQPAGEMKYFDCELAQTSIVACTTTWPAGTMQDPGTTINLGSAAVPTPFCLFAPTVGSALNQRIGRSVLVRKIKVSGALLTPQQSAQALADTACRLRLLLVQDTQTNATQMTAAQLLNDAGNGATTLSSYQNPNNFGRFRVLKDKLINLTNPNMTGSPSGTDIVQGSLVRSFKFSVNFKEPVKVQFNNTNGGTVADIVDNSFHIICGASNITLTPVITYYSRVAYKE